VEVRAAVDTALVKRVVEYDVEYCVIVVVEVDVTEEKIKLEPDARTEVA
jgi:hypothetical protein